MRKLRFVFVVIIDICIILYFIFAPSIIRQGIEESRVSYWKYADEDFCGMINVWHVAQFKTHTGAVGNLIKEQAKIISKKHFGVYFTVTAMTPDEYYERIARGESADIYSLPLGFEYSDIFLPLDESLTSGIRPSLISTGSDGDTLYALPYLYSGYCLMENTELTKNTDAESISSAEDLKNAVSAYTSDKHVPLCGNVVYACEYGYSGSFDETKSFKDGKTEYAVTDFRTVGDLERLQQRGKGFTHRYIALDNYTDLVQYLLLNKKLQPEKYKYCAELISLLLSDKVQTALSSMNAYPVNETADIEALRDSYSSVALELFSLYMNPKVPNFFLYRQHRDALFSDAKAAISGDSDAKKRFDERMAELFPLS